MVLFFFLLGNIGQENVFYDILEQEKGFSTLKKRRQKKNLSIFLAIYDVVEQKWPLYAIKTRSPKVEKLRNGIFLSFS